MNPSSGHRLPLVMSLLTAIDSIGPFSRSMTMNDENMNISIAMMPGTIRSTKPMATRIPTARLAMK